MTTSKFLLSIMISTLLLLGACGGDDADTAASASAAPAAAATSDDSMDLGSSMDFEKAEGVVYQDEIYANWPYN